jgi:putative FmdB family regulatory protein
MPIYEFVCKDCRNEFKTLKRSNQLDAVSCPTCGTARVARLLSVTARTGSDEKADAMADMGGCMRPGGCCMNTGGCSLN